MSRFAVILPAAGQSSRMLGLKRKKPFVELKGRPVWIRTVEHFLKRNDVLETVLVIAPDDMEWFRSTYSANLAFMDVRLVKGGTCRAASVLNGLQALESDATHVAVHDAARPLLTQQWIDSVFAAATEHGAAVPGLRISSTVKRVNSAGIIEKTVDRTNLVQAQTPQVFERQLLLKAYDFCTSLPDATDEASMVEQLGVPVHVVDGWAANIKLTTSEDLRIAEKLLDVLPAGGGLKSLHPFDDDRFL
ncbi:MAG: 2-C-methyl-D-erythritol 4-phosphate cytidylyltransferase [Planctomycetaceae bacterium]|nr:2-C-methyl-D-erythritol 4-phosphate cytidylyltransferase [Planctomycetaceae bacterium]